MNWNSQYAIELIQLHLIESTAIGLAIVLILHLSRIRRASLRFTLSQVALIKFLLPIGSLCSIANFHSTTETTSPLALTLNTWVSNTAQFAHSDTGLSLWTIAVSIWILGTVTVATRYTIGWITASPKTITPPNSRDQNRIAIALTHFGSPHFLSNIQLTPETTSPIALVGIFRPRIVINNAFFHALSDSELRSALRHELEHLRRKDNLSRLLQAFAVSLFWFHPLVWYAHSRSCFESECACDEAAMNEGKERKEYANCLLKATSFLSSTDTLWAAALTGNPLKRRIQQIVNFKNEKDSKMKSLSIWVLTLSIITGTSLLASDYKHLTNTTEQTSEKIYNLSELDTKPQAAYQVGPIIPAKLRESKTSAFAVIEWVINPEGKVIDAQAIKSSHVEFEQPVIDAVYKSKWIPGKINGKAVSVIVQQRAVFNP